MAEIQQLKADLEEQKKKTKEVELFYEESIKLGMKLVNMTDKYACYEEIKQLKIELEEQKKKTKEAELIAEEVMKLLDIRDRVS